MSALAEIKAVKECVIRSGYTLQNKLIIVYQRWLYFITNRFYMDFYMFFICPTVYAYKPWDI